MIRMFRPKDARFIAVIDGRLRHPETSLETMVAIRLTDASARHIEGISKIPRESKPLERIHSYVCVDEANLERS